MKSLEELAREFDNVIFIEFIKNIQRDLRNMAINDEINRLQSIILKEISSYKKDSTIKIKIK